MMTVTPLSPRALEVVADGPLVRADVPRVIDEVLEFMRSAGGKIDVLADVRGAPDLHFDLFIEEAKRLPDLLRVARGMDRVALIADKAWVRVLTRVESALVPGVTYEVYDRERAAHARAWLLRQTDEPYPS